MAETGESTFETGMKAGDKAFMTAYNSGDAAAVAAFYAEDGQVLPPNADFVKGRAAIQAFWEGAMKAGINSLQLVTDELEDHGDTALSVGRYKLFGEGAREIDQGKFVVIFKQVGGQWKLYRDIFNSSNPSAGA